MYDEEKGQENHIGPNQTPLPNRRNHRSPGRVYSAIDKTEIIEKKPNIIHVLAGRKDNRWEIKTTTDSRKVSTPPFSESSKIDSTSSGASGYFGMSADRRPSHSSH